MTGKNTINFEEELQAILMCKPLRSEIRLDTADLILYGAGKGGKMALDLLQRSGREIKYIVDRNCRGELQGCKVILPEEIPEYDKENALFLICIATYPYNEIAGYLRSLGIVHFMHHYVYMSQRYPMYLDNGWRCLEPDDYDIACIRHVGQILQHDDVSVHHYLQFLWLKLRGREVIDSKYPVLSGKKYWSAPCMPCMGGMRPCWMEEATWEIVLNFFYRLRTAFMVMYGP